MSTLDDMVVIRDAHTVLPVVSIGIGQLVELALRLITDVVHALIVSDHAIFLKTNCHHLTVTRI